MKATEAQKEFSTIFQRFSIHRSVHTAFDNFLDYAIYKLAIDRKKEDQEKVDAYKQEERDTLEKLFELWSIASDNDGEGFHDALGDIFMEFLSYGKNGQFFTPDHICDMMAQMTTPHGKPGQTVMDPTCGSGRMLLSAAKMVERKMHFYGADNDLRCAKMAALNMTINTMHGEIAHMNTLTMEHYGGFKIDVVTGGGIFYPFLTRLKAGETVLVPKLRETMKQQQSKPVEAEGPKINKKGQVSLF